MEPKQLSPIEVTRPMAATDNAAQDQQAAGAASAPAGAITAPDNAAQDQQAAITAPENAAQDKQAAIPMMYWKSASSDSNSDGSVKEDPIDRGKVLRTNSTIY